MNKKVELSEEEQRFMDKIKNLVEQAHKEGYMDGFKAGMGKSMDDEGLDGVSVHRIIVSKTMLLALLIIIFGSVFSFGMYIGRSYV